MQHDHVLKKMVVGRGLRAKYLLPFCCNRDSPKFDMQHDYVLKKLNFDLSTTDPGSGGRVLRAKCLLPSCCICESL